MQHYLNVRRSGYPYPDNRLHETNSDDADKTLGVGVGTPRPTDIYEIAKMNGWPEYLIDNAKVALQALDIMGINYDSE